VFFVCDDFAVLLAAGEEKQDNTVGFYEINIAGAYI
jgi:hypothetical protein